MYARNSSRDAEQAQDAADVVAPSATHPRDLQDEGGHVTFCHSASAAGPNQTDPNYDQTMQQVVRDLYSMEIDDNEQKNKKKTSKQKTTTNNKKMMMIEWKSAMRHHLLTRSLNPSSTE